MEGFLKYFKGDKYIWLIILALSLYGVLAVYSSTQSLAYKYSKPSSVYVIKHLAVLLISFGTMWFIHQIPYQYFGGFYKLFLPLSVLLLIIAHTYGKQVNDAGRWIELPIIGETIQASDVAKLALALFLSRFLSKNQDKLDNFKKTFLPMLGVTALLCFLVFLDNVSTSVMMFFTALIIMFVGRVKLSHFLGTLAVLAVGTVLSIKLLLSLPDNILEMHRRLPTAKYRILEFIDTKKSKKNIQYQVKQANIGIARGGILPNGPGNSRQKNFLPNAFSDYVFVIIIEEYGLILGGMGILGLYLGLIYRIILIVTNSPRTFGALLSLGLGLSIVIQAFFNMMVNVGLLPSTGVTLPFVSMGGSSIVFFGVAVGIIISVSRSVEVGDLGSLPKNDTYIDDIAQFQAI